MKWIILILIVMLATTVLADKGLIEIYKPNEVFDLSIHLSNFTGNVEGANCSLQIRNESYGTINNDNLNEIGGGWYNYTYNTSKVGKYFCRYNCTQGASFIAETCDFIIESDEKMGITIAIVLIGATFIFLALAFFTSSKQHLPLKLFFLIISMLMLLVGLNFAHAFSVESGAASSIQSVLLSIYKVGIYAFIIFVAYMVLFYIYTVLHYFKQYGHH